MQRRSLLRAELCFALRLLCKGCNKATRSGTPSLSCLPSAFALPPRWSSATLHAAHVSARAAGRRFDSLMLLYGLTAKYRTCAGFGRLPRNLHLLSIRRCLSRSCAARCARRLAALGTAASSRGTLSSSGQFGPPLPCRRCIAATSSRSRRRCPGSHYRKARLAQLCQSRQQSLKTHHRGSRADGPQVARRCFSSAVNFRTGIHRD